MSTGLRQTGVAKVDEHGVEPRELDSPAVDELFEVLENRHARCLLAAMGTEPVTASELSATCGVASSTLYRQLGELIEAGLVEKSIRLDRGGHHASQFTRAISDISITLDGDVTVTVS